MARYTSEAVISYFNGDDSEGLMFDGSDDDLGMEDEEGNDSDPEFLIYVFICPQYLEQVRFIHCFCTFTSII